MSYRCRCIVRSCIVEVSNGSSIVFQDNAMGHVIVLEKVLVVGRRKEIIFTPDGERLTTRGDGGLH